MPNLTILFWNLQKRSIPTRVANIISHYDVDIVVLAECRLDRAEFAGKVSKVARQDFSEVGYALPEDQTDPKIRIFSHLRSPVIRGTYVSLHGDLVAVTLSVGGANTTLIALHLRAPFKGSKELSSQYVPRIVEKIAQIEEEAGHSNTVLVGDFNMNPYDPGLTGKFALSAVVSQSQLRDREYLGEKGLKSFYNPMWGLFGDRTEGPSGTLKLELEGDANCWHMVDQVLVRESLASTIEDLRILDSDGSISLLTPAGYPNSSVGSDHLPVLVKLNLHKEATL